MYRYEYRTFNPALVLMDMSHVDLLGVSEGETNLSCFLGAADALLKMNFNVWEENVCKSK